MFLVAANTRQALVGQKEWITTGSSGIQVQFLFSDDWDGLSKFAVFRNAEIEESVIPIALPSSNLTELPAENCAAEYVDEKVYVGVYGTDGLGHIIIPTIWVSLGVLKEGAAYEGMDPPQPTPDMWAQILAIAQNAGAENAEAAEKAEAEAKEAASTAKDAAAEVKNLSVDADTLAAGEPATVEKTVDAGTGALKLKFGIPQGPQGEPMTYEDMTEEQKAELVQGPILEAQTSAVAAVGSARTTAVNAVNQAGTTQTGAVNQAGANQVTAVNQAGATQAQAVEDKGAEVIGSIPPDYSDLAAEVDDLNRQLNDETTGLDTKAPVILETASGAIASFDDGADSMPIRKIVATIEPVQSGSGDPSPDNERTISGWTGAEIEHAAYYRAFIPSTLTIGAEVVKNGLHIKYLGGGVFRVYGTTTGTVTSDYINITPIPVTDTNGYKVHLNNSINDQYISVYLYAGSVNAGLPLSPKNTTWDNAGRFEGLSFDKFTVVVYGAKTCDFTIKIEFEKDMRTPLPINWETEAGTVYGGTVTLNEDGSADVVSNMAKVVCNAATRVHSTLDVGTTCSGDNFTLPAQAKHGSGNYTPSGAICSISNTERGTYYNAAVRNDEFFNNHPDISVLYIVSQTGNSIYVFIRGTDYTSESYNDAIAVCEICYYLATPVTYHFDNVGQLFTFFGENNVWCDTGDITELDYCADTKLFLTARDEEITGNIAPIENGTTASQAYAQGAYFWHDTKFCKALTAIASGATFTNGTNYTETTVAAELLAAQN